MAADGATTWVPSASPEDRATADHGLAVVGCKEPRRNEPTALATSDRIVLCLTRVMRFAVCERISAQRHEAHAAAGVSA